MMLPFEFLSLKRQSDVVSERREMIISAGIPVDYEYLKECFIEELAGKGINVDCVVVGGVLTTIKGSLNIKDVLKDYLRKNIKDPIRKNIKSIYFSIKHVEGFSLYIGHPIKNDSYLNVVGSHNMTQENIRMCLELLNSIIEVHILQFYVRVGEYYKEEFLWKTSDEYIIDLIKEEDLLYNTENALLDAF